MSRLPYLFFLTALTVTTFIIRWESFKDTEPRIDQAYFAASVRGIVESNHVWPQKSPGQSFSQALLRDEGSLLHQIGRPIFNTPQFCFNLVPVVVSSIVCGLFSYCYANLVFLSILVTCLCLLPLGYLPFAAFGEFEKQSPPLQIMGIGTTLAYALTFQVSLFSPWGVHNAGVFFLVIAVVASVRLLRDATSWRYRPVRSLSLTLLFAGIACYSHWTNVLVLLPALAISLLTIRDVSLGRRIAFTAGLVLLMSGILLPVGILSAVLHRVDDNFLVYMNSGNSAWALLGGVPSRALKWFSAGCELFSPPGLLLGIAGLVWMARKYRIVLPLICLAVHFSAYCVIPGSIWNGSPTWLRTYNYVFPFLSVGMGAMLALVWRGLPGGGWPVVGRLMVGVCFLSHIYLQIPQLRSTEWLRNRSSVFYQYYLEGQGNLRPTVAGLEGAIPESEPILFWDYPLRMLYRSLARSSGRNPIIASTITSRLSKVETRDRSNESQLPTNMHVVAPETVSARELENALVTILRMAGVKDVRGVSLSPRGRWNTGTGTYEVIILYDAQQI